MKNHVEWTFNSFHRDNPGGNYTGWVPKFDAIMLDCHDNELDKMSRTENLYCYPDKDEANNMIRESVVLEILKEWGEKYGITKNDIKKSPSAG